MLVFSTFLGKGITIKKKNFFFIVLVLYLIRPRKIKKLKNILKLFKYQNLRPFKKF
jgi:hypothetical protein